MGDTWIRDKIGPCQTLTWIVSGMIKKLDYVKSWALVKSSRLKQEDFTPLVLRLKKVSQMLFKELSYSSSLAKRKEEAHCIDHSESRRAQGVSSSQRELS